MYRDAIGCASGSVEVHVGSTVVDGRSMRRVEALTFARDVQVVMLTFLSSVNHECGARTRIGQQGRRYVGSLEGWADGGLTDNIFEPLGYGF